MHHIRVGHRDIHSGWEASGDPWEKHGAVEVLVTQSCPAVWTLRAIACQAPLFMGFSRQEYWSGLPFPFPENLPNPGSPALQADSLPSELKGSQGRPFSRTAMWPPWDRLLSSAMQSWRLPTGYFAIKRTVRNSEQLSIYSGFPPPHSIPLQCGMDARDKV